MHRGIFANKFNCAKQFTTTEGLGFSRFNCLKYYKDKRKQFGATVDFNKTTHWHLEITANVKYVSTELITISVKSSTTESL